MKHYQTVVFIETLELICLTILYAYQPYEHNCCWLKLVVMSKNPVNTVGILFALYVLTSLAHVIYHFFLVTLVTSYHSFSVMIVSLLI